MLFTIAIPTYNNEKTILKTIKSCINQNFDDEYEVLVVNNASTDNTKKILQSLVDLKIRIIENKENVSLFENHNICLKEAKGEYVIFCHSDDELKIEALKILKEKLRSRNYPKRYIIWGQSMFRDFYEYLKQFNVLYNTIISGERAIQIFAIPNGLTPSGTCYSRKSLLEIGGFYKMKTRTTPSDWTIMLNAALNEFEFEMLDRLLFVRKFASTAIGRNNKEIKRDIKDAFSEFLENQTIENKEIVRNNLLMTYNNLSYMLLNKFFKIKFKIKIKYLLKIAYFYPKEIIRILLKR